MRLQRACRPATAAAAAPVSGARSSCPSADPDGGDGGNGGSVYLRAATGINTLADFRIERTYKAGHGEAGGANDCTGRGGSDLYVPVPIGTVVRDSDTHEVLGDLTRDGEELLVARGGKGGWGNQRFKSSTNRSPRQFGPGLPGEKRSLELELKLIADVGLLGLPNAGKSTLIRAVSAAQTQGRRLPFHDPAPEPRGGGGGPAPQLRDGRHPGTHRGGGRGGGPGHPLPEAPAAHTRAACTWWTSCRRTRPRIR